MPGDGIDIEMAQLAHDLQVVAQPLEGARGDYDALLQVIGDARLVLIGEASHGTQEFYHERAQITKRLIQEKGFTAVAVEADWPDAYRINRYVRGIGGGQSSLDALDGFKRFPAWMWRNTEVLDFVGWLRERNDSLTSGRAKAGFYGLDLYSLGASTEAVIRYLDTVDPEAARRARYRYGCFEHFGEDPQTYGYAASFSLDESCEKEVVNQLIELRTSAGEYLARDGFVSEDEYFYAEQNARLAKNAEKYYRTMFSGRASAWNLRDRHMAKTLDALMEHLDSQLKRGRAQSPGQAKVVVWAHNSHLGDARATEMAEAGELNLGQLVREKYGRASALVGFTTYTGMVTAASGWDRPEERKQVRPALQGSYEAIFHQVGLSRFWLPLRDGGGMAARLREPRLERAIGVIYLPQSERVSHYFEARLRDQFDAVIHIDYTHALQPLEPASGWSQGEDSGEVPETFPTAL
jgi:erythromycin esterase-like protein